MSTTLLSSSHRASHQPHHTMDTLEFPKTWRFRHYLVDYPTCPVKQASIVVLDALESPFESRTFPESSLRCVIEETSLDSFLAALATKVKGETIRRSTVWSSPSTEPLFPLIVHRCTGAAIPSRAPLSGLTVPARL